MPLTEQFQARFQTRAVIFRDLALARLAAPAPRQVAPRAPGVMPAQQMPSPLRVVAVNPSGTPSKGLVRVRFNDGVVIQEMTPPPRTPVCFLVIFVDAGRRDERCWRWTLRRGDYPADRGGGGGAESWICAGAGPGADSVWEPGHAAGPGWRRAGAHGLLPVGGVGCCRRWWRWASVGALFSSQRALVPSTDFLVPSAAASGWPELCIL